MEKFAKKAPKKDNKNPFIPVQSYGHANISFKKGQGGKQGIKGKFSVGQKRKNVTFSPGARQDSKKKFDDDDDDDDDYYANLAMEGEKMYNDQDNILKEKKKMRPNIHSSRSSPVFDKSSSKIFDSEDDESDLSSNKQAPGLEKFRQNLIDSLAGGDDDDDEDEEDNIKITPENIPRGFEDMAKNEDGEFDFDKMSQMSKKARKNKQTKKVLSERITDEDEEACVDNDEMGFIYEPCMLPKEFWLRNRLRERSNKRRYMELKNVQSKQNNHQENKEIEPKQQKSSSNTGSAKYTGKDMLILEHDCHDEDNMKSAVIAFPEDIAEDPRNTMLEYEEGYDHSGCVACRRGTNGAAPIPIEALNNLIQNYVENRGYKDPEELAIDLEEQFEKCIRQPANANIKPGEQPIPMFTAEDIYFHMKKHDQDPSVWLCNRLEMLDNHIEQLYHSGVYRVAKSKTRPKESVSNINGKSYMNSKPRYENIRPQDIRVAEKYHKMMMDAVKLEHSLYKSKPSEMFLYNKHKTVKMDTIRPWVNNKRPVYTETNKKVDLWSKGKNRF